MIIDIVKKFKDQTGMEHDAQVEWYFPLRMWLIRELALDATKREKFEQECE